jgi:hypothetical protein
MVLLEGQAYRFSLWHTRCDNLIPGMAAACRWGVESGKLMYPGTFGHVSTCVYMSHRPNESFVSKQQRIGNRIYWTLKQLVITLYRSL